MKPERSALRSVLLGVLLVFVSGNAAPAQSGLKLSGYFKNYSILFDPPPIRGGARRRPSGLASNRFRLNLYYEPLSWLSMDAAYDIDPQIQDPSFDRQQLLFAEINPFTYRFADLSPRLYPSGSLPPGSFDVYQNLDRAMFTLRTPKADVILGRQAIAWGSARVVNPTDVIAPFTFETLDTEDRIGVDAVRVRIPLGLLAEIDTGYVFGDKFRFENSAFFARTRFNVRQTDIALLLMGFRENLLAGFDVARAIGGAGFYLESAYVFAGALDDHSLERKYNYFRASVGLDYSFNGKTYGFLEYHFNGAGSSNPVDYLRELSRPAYQQGGVYLMGRQYLAPGLTYQLTPLIIFSGQALMNVADPSLFLAPQVEYNIAVNVYLSGGGFIGLGRHPRYSAEAGGIVLDSEFGGYPNIFFGSFRIYF